MYCNLVKTRLGSKKDFTKDKIPRCQHTDHRIRIRIVILTILLSLGEEVIRANTLSQVLASSRRSVRGSARKTAREKMKKALFRAVFRAAPD